MKVLFAVSSESISEAIIKRYQKEYKEILSYKNVYYFNAILKEIQKDKTYDRIVISEDLEPFSNNNYDTIDKFIFEKLDNISDEAHDSQGKEASIILICTDRRVKGNSILVKLFGIGVYNALLGNDRSMEEVCKLINRPRSKKEAKIYYRIDSEDVNYKAENENEVSEVEIQNILAHFKKLGKNTAKYSESFNNIAVQYTDEQLRIIVNCLPINVKAILETNCERYQELMAVTGGIPSVKGIVSNDEGSMRNEINERKIGQAANMTRPIVIPSAVRNAKNAPHPVIKKATPTVEKAETAQVAKPATKKVVSEPVQNAQAVNTVKTETVKRPAVATRPAPQTVVSKPVVKPVAPVKQEPVEDISNIDLDILPDFEESTEEVSDEPRRGRGRPKKTPVGGVEVKPKGKRGRPKKVSEEPVEEELDDEIILPGLDDLNEVPAVEEDDDELLPGFEENDEVEEVEEVEEELPEEEYEEVQDEEELDEDYTDEISLPGLDELDDEEEVENVLEDEEIENDELLPGIEETPEEEYEEVEEEIPEEEYEEELDEDYTDEVSLPGLDDLDDEFSDVETKTEDEVDEEIEEDDGLLPGISNIEEDDEEDEDDGLLPGIGNTEEDEEETLLPGMGFEDEEDTIISQRPVSSMDTNSLESIKPKVDYSMSSLNSLITKDKKIVTFIGTSKNGTSFLVNNLATLFSSLGINTAILDMTKNKNSYFIYTKNEEELRTKAYNSIEKLQNGYAEGVRVDKNLTVYTDLPNSGKDYSDAEPILSTLAQNYSLILIDCDYETDISYFAMCQEVYLVQSMDILTIQPLTAFLRELKTRGVLEPEKIRVVINKEMKIHKRVGDKDIIGGLAYYNDPAMSFMTELFNKDTVKACSIPFDQNAYAKYLGGIVDCDVSLNGYSKAFLSKLKLLGDMVYPLTSKQSYSNKAGTDYNPNAFSSSMNDTLSKMRKKY